MSWINGIRGLVNAFDTTQVKDKRDAVNGRFAKIKNMAASRRKRLEESLEYQQFVANVEEEEAWINEKLNLVGSEDYGDTLAAVQVLHCYTMLRNRS
uniref:Uncharacterized protein n=1 Tax=Neolamprologus brichardi TaxID=32507 RepID=A0A3Q4GFV3_NEOBR